MTKQHFIALADHIRKIHQISDNPQIVESLADFCAKQNPNFKRERWIDYVALKCGPNGGAVKK